MRELDEKRVMVVKNGVPPGVGWPPMSNAAEWSRRIRTKKRQSDLAIQSNFSSVVGSEQLYR